MSRNEHPRSVEQLEEDAATFGASSPQERHRMLCELTHRYLRRAWDNIDRSREVLDRVNRDISRSASPRSL